LNVTIVRRGKDLVVTFDYAPSIVEKVRGLRSRRWDPSQKSWLVPVSDYAELVKALEGCDLRFVPKDLVLQIAKEAERRMSCFKCGEGISCEECSYVETCMVRSVAEYCLCDGCLGEDDAYTFYAVCFAKRLE